MNKSIELTQKQSNLYRILDDPNNRRLLIHGGARSGKTLTITLWLLAQMCTYPGIKILCLRKHRVHVRTTLFEGTFKELIKDRKEYTIEETTMEIHHNNGSSIRFDGIDNKERVDKILGSEYAIIFLNEASQMEYKSVKVIISRLAQALPNLKKRTLIMDTNPKGSLHWIYRLCITGNDPETNEPTKDEWKTMSFNPLDNPYLPEDTLLSLQSLTGVERQRLYEGEWVSVEGLAYPMFDINRHIKTIDTNKSSKYIIGVDCGTNDPMVLALFAIVNNAEGLDSLHMVDCYYKPGKDMSISLGDVAERWRELDPYIVVDPSASPAIVELKSRGFRCESANNKIIEGIMVMGDLLNTDRLTFSPTCSNELVEEIQQYELDPKTEKPTNETPHHCLDATRYASQAFLSGEYDDSSFVGIF